MNNTGKTYKTHELPINAQVNVLLKDKTNEKGWLETVTFTGMDGMYGRFVRENGDILNSYGTLSKTKGIYYFIN